MHIFVCDCVIFSHNKIHFSLTVRIFPFDLKAQKKRNKLNIFHVGGMNSILVVSNFILLFIQEIFRSGIFFLWHIQTSQHFRAFSVILRFHEKKFCFSIRFFFFYSARRCLPRWVLKLTFMFHFKNKQLVSLVRQGRQVHMTKITSKFVEPKLADYSVDRSEQLWVEFCA